MRVYIGYDSREIDAFNVCKSSIERHATEMVEIIPLKRSALQARGLYYRHWEEVDGVNYDKIDGKPFSTEFAFSRFLVPEMNHFQDWALFMDCDMLITRDIKEVFDMKDPRYAVMCVQHEYTPPETTKMDGAPQQTYYRKNWSSFVLWNCGHPKNQALTATVVNKETGAFLHGFKWLEDEDIGALPEEWNWLEGHSPINGLPANIHYTRGGPWFPRWRNVQYADLWNEEFESL